MKTYLNPEMEIVMLSAKDVIATSGINGPEDGVIGNPDNDGTPW